MLLIACTRRGPSSPAATAGGLIAGSASAAWSTPAQAAGTAGAAAGTLVAGSVVAGSAAAGASVSLAKLALFFLKVGAVLYGSGYVLVAYLQSGLVDERHWLTQQQLLDAVAVGQFTPGPLLSTAAFIGYLLGQRAGVGGPAGAGVATVAIFAPSFVFVTLTAPWIARLRKLRGTAVVLGAVNAASIGLMVAVTVNLAVDLATGRSLHDVLDDRRRRQRQGRPAPRPANPHRAGSAGRGPALEAGRRLARAGQHPRRAGAVPMVGWAKAA